MNALQMLLNTRTVLNTSGFWSTVSTDEYKMSVWTEKSGYGGIDGMNVYVRMAYYVPEHNGETFDMVSAHIFIEDNPIMPALDGTRVCKVSAKPTNVFNEFNELVEFPDYYKFEVRSLGNDIIQLTIGDTLPGDVEAYPNPCEERWLLHNFTEYNPRLCHDGGQYSFTEKYTNIGNGYWMVSYHTSASMEYCHMCGRFGCTGWDCGYSVVSTKDVQEAIRAFEEAYKDTDLCWVEHEVGGKKAE